MNWGSSFYSRNSVLSLVQTKMTKFCCRRRRWREAHLTILETAALWNDYKASCRQQVEWLHPEWRFLLNAEFDYGSLLFSCRWSFHEAFHLLVVETFGKVGMTVQDAESHECIPMFDETREQTWLLKRIVLLLIFFVLCQSSVHDRTCGGFVFFT